MDEQGRGLALGLLAHIQPHVVEEHHVGAQFFFGAAVAGGAHDVAARNAGAVRLQNAFQAQAFVIAGNFARDADMLDGRHVHQEAAGQGDVRSDARALLSQWLLGDLDDDFLAFPEQIADGREASPVLVGLGAASPGLLRARGGAPRLRPQGRASFSRSGRDLHVAVTIFSPRSQSGVGSAIFRSTIFRSTVAATPLAAHTAGKAMLVAGSLLA